MFKAYFLAVFAAVVFAVAPVSAQAETHSHELAMKIVDSDKAFDAFDRFASNYESAQEKFNDEMIARSTNGKSRDGLSRQLPAMLKMKLEALQSIRAQVPEIYAQILLERFNEKELVLMSNAQESKDDYKAYVSSSAMPKAIKLAFEFDQMGMKRVNALLDKKLHEKSFAQAAARLLVDGEKSATD
jgi:hypothetical protein